MKYNIVVKYNGKFELTFCFLKFIINNLFVNFFYLHSLKILFVGKILNYIVNIEI